MDLNRIPAPAFVLDESRLRANLELIAGVRDRAGVEIILALKGFAMWRVFPMVAQYLDGATASSVYEARLIREEMGCKAHTYCVAYFPEDLDELMDYSSHLTFNSLSQFRRFFPKVREKAPDISCGIRVNPEFSDVSTDLYNPASKGSRLGELAGKFEAGLPEGVEGLHAHTLCESGSQATEGLIKAVEKNFGRFLPVLKWVNFGGGHLMTRPGYDVEHLVKVLQAFRTRHPHLQVILEPGSAIAWDTGVLLARVLDIHESAGIRTLITDVSFTAHMPDTLEMPYRPRIRGASDPVQGKPAYRIGGTSCLAGDYMEAYSFEREPAVGDMLVFEDMIHYTMVKTTMFNGVKHPNICIWKESGEPELVRRFTFDDYKNRLS